MISITNHNDIIKLVPVSAVSVIGDQLKTTSLKVAEFFGKQHKDVLKKIDSLDCSPEFSSANFSAHVQKVNIGKGATRESKYYEMTKDGFMFLVMGFTGKAAAQIKEAYIYAFNKMAEALQSKQQAKVIEALTPVMQRHIQKRVTEMTLCGSGLSYPQVYRQIKDHFKVGTYKDIPASKYPALCQFLKCQPDPEALQGELLERETLPEPVKFALTQSQAATLLRLLHSVDWVNFRLSQGILSSLAAINPKLYGRTVEHVQNMARDGRMLDRELVHIEKAKEFEYMGGAVRPAACIERGFID